MFILGLLGSVCRAWPHRLTRTEPVSITFSNFPRDDFPNGTGSVKIKFSSDTDLRELLSGIGAVAVEESANSSGDIVASPSLSVLKEGVPYRFVFKPRYETAIGRIENGIKNSATAFEHKANLAFMNELTLLGKTKVELAMQGVCILRGKGVTATEIDGLVFAAASAADAAASVPDDAYVLEAKMYAKIDDLAAVEKKMQILTHPPADTLNPINLGGRALTGVLATIDTTPEVIAAAKAKSMWVLVQNGSGFDLITHE